MTAETQILTADRVNHVFQDCLFKDNEDESMRVLADIGPRTVSFHLDRLNGHRQEIHDMLDQLPDQFMFSKGGGFSILMAGLDKHNEVWSELNQEVVHRLILLAVASEEGEYIPTVEMIPAPLPGPCFAVKQ
jgi:hypothetical protein